MWLKINKFPLNQKNDTHTYEVLQKNFEWVITEDAQLKWIVCFGGLFGI